ncbi:hypothetical protein F4780DRAFT_780002 [Xylariomycetidae sp. FL0641]|nr:hypothetical protein F4780DRAFT_780002 [Xylariomycetidae sp. FL0641]
MPSLSEPVPVVLVGLSTAIGGPVTEGLRPEYEVIRFIQSLPAAAADLPHLLAGAPPPTAPTNDVGTANYEAGAAPRAVIFGRAFAPADVEALRAQVRDAAKHPVAWVVGDPAKTPQTGGAGPPPGYAQKGAQAVKDKIREWRERGAEEDELVLY